MFETIDNILVIKNSKSKKTYFFDFEFLTIFSKSSNKEDEKIIKDYKEYIKNQKNNLSSNKTKKNLEFSSISSMTLELSITNDCNLRCKYCYNDKNCHTEKTSHMSKDIIEKSFQLALKTYPNCKIFRISLFGGEPLISFKNFDFIVKKAKEIFKNKKVMISFPTNGTILNNQIISFLKKNNISFQISLDGPKNQQNFLRPTSLDANSFELIDKNLPKFKKLNKSLPVRATITPYNMNLSKLFLFFKKKGFKSVAFALCSSSDQNFIFDKKDISKLFFEYEKLAKVYLKHLINDKEIVILKPFYNFLKDLHLGNKKRYFCGVKKNILSISPNGNIYSCHRFIGNDEFKVGDILNGLDKKNLMSNFFFGIDIEDKKDCQSCFAKFICGGGCLHERHLFTTKISCPVIRFNLYQSIKMYIDLLENHPKIFEKLTHLFEKK